MATTTSNSTASTTYTYNEDYSAADAYKPVEITQPTVNTPTYNVAKQDDIDTYASENNIDYTYKEADLANKYQQLQDATLENTLYGIAQSQNNYNQSMNDTNRSVIDALRSETASAIANGTSRGVTDANVLKSILGLQQESVADATELAQQYGQAYKDYGENSAQAWIDANSTAANYQNQLLADTLEKFEAAQTSLDNRYTADAGLAATQYESDANLEAQRYAADAGIYDDVLTSLINQVISEETSSSATTTEPDVVSTSSTDTTGTTGTTDTKTEIGNTGNAYSDKAITTAQNLAAKDNTPTITVSEATSKSYGSKYLAQQALNKLGTNGNNYELTNKNGKWYITRKATAGTSGGNAVKAVSNLPTAATLAKSRTTTSTITPQLYNYAGQVSTSPYAGYNS